jgi:hypothetical protein
VIATPLHWLIAAEHLLDRSAQGFGPIDDEQVFAVCRQAVIAKAVSKRLTLAAFSVAPDSIPRMCFLPSVSTPTALRM